jgi:hypothetical protein
MVSVTIISHVKVTLQIVITILTDYIWAWDLKAPMHIGLVITIWCLVSILESRSEIPPMLEKDDDKLE